MKKIYYLCGLPRAGNTLFGSVLNQNPKIQVSSNSLVSEVLWKIENLKKERAFKNFPDHSSLDNISANVVSNYYKDWNCDVILDRSSWGSPNNFELIKKYAPNEIKFVVLVRDVQQVMASFIKWSEENKPNFIDEKTDGDLRSKCDYLMDKDGILVQSYISIFHILNSNYPYYLIEYNDLVKNTKEVIDGLYDFLGIESFEHRFADLNQFSANEICYDDNQLGQNLHTIKTEGISLSDYMIDKYLPRDLLDYYSTLNFWK